MYIYGILETQCMSIKSLTSHTRTCTPLPLDFKKYMSEKIVFLIIIIDWELYGACAA